MTNINPYQLSHWCDNYLMAAEYADYCPNGLQIDAHQHQPNSSHSSTDLNRTDLKNTALSNIDTLITGVTACEALIDVAIARKAQAIMVHHGYFWKGEDPRLIGMKGKRVQKLMQHGISLIAYHLPLDAHPVVGNNAQLGKLLSLSDMQPLYPEKKHSIGNIFSTDGITPQQLVERITHTLQRQPLHISAHHMPHNRLGNDTLNNRKLTRIAICTGAAQDMIEQAITMNCDAFISGEVSERTTHTAREMGIDYFACGHHATEKGGIQALGELIHKEFKLNVEFVDIDNPV